MILLNPKLESYVQSLDLDSISSERKQVLLELSTIIREESELNSFLFVCTHNSRRSHLAQVWFAVMAARFAHSGLLSFSAGTEATTFYPSAIVALQEAGIDVINTADDKNASAELTFSDGCESIKCFSKTTEHKSIPRKNLVAIMTCDHADVNCPHIIGAEKRISLNYIDPKWADSSSEEAEAYEACSRLIATEMKFVFTKAQ